VQVFEVSIVISRQPGEIFDLMKSIIFSISVSVVRIIVRPWKLPGKHTFKNNTASSCPT
jgi:hypothetical protein